MYTLKTNSIVSVEVKSSITYLKYYLERWVPLAIISINSDDVGNMTYIECALVEVPDSNNFDT